METLHFWHSTYIFIYSPLHLEWQVSNYFINLLYIFVCIWVFSVYYAFFFTHPTKVHWFSNLDMSVYGVTHTVSVLRNTPCGMGRSKTVSRVQVVPGYRNEISKSAILLVHQSDWCLPGHRILHSSLSNRCTVLVKIRLEANYLLANMLSNRVVNCCAFSLFYVNVNVNVLMHPLTLLYSICLLFFHV